MAVKRYTAIADTTITNAYGTEYSPDVGGPS